MSCKVTASILIFSLSVSAGPVLSTSNDGNVCLAVSLVLLSVLAILVALKCLFIKQRRAQSIRSKSSTRPSTPARSSVTLGSHLSVSCNSLHDNRGKPGVLIGLFGSPIWETRLNESLNEGPTISRSSLMYQLHTKSRRTRTQHRGSRSRSTLRLPQANGHLAVNDSLKRRGSGSSQPPMRQRAKSESTGTSIHFVRSTYSIEATNTRRRSNSVGPTITQSHEDSGFSHVQSYASLRLVNQSINTSPPATVTEPPVLLPSAVHFSPSQMPISTVDSLYFPSKPPKAETRVRTVRPNSVTLHYDTTGTTAFFSSDLSSCDTPPRSPLSPVNGTINSRVSESQSKVSPVALSSPFYPQPSAAKMFIKRAKMARSRKSPPLGPSPLRTMILPETLLLEQDSSMDRLKANEADVEGHLARKSENRGASFRDSGDRSKSKNLSFPGGANENLESNMLLGMIRDLVEETKEWDQSLFMNENFRTLISDCGLLKSTSDLLDGLTRDFSRPKTSLAQEPNESPCVTDGAIELDLLWQEDGSRSLSAKDGIGVAL